MKCNGKLTGTAVADLTARDVDGERVEVGGQARWAALRYHLIERRHLLVLVAILAVRRQPPDAVDTDVITHEILALILLIHQKLAAEFAPCEHTCE